MPRPSSTGLWIAVMAAALLGMTGAWWGCSGERVGKQSSPNVVVIVIDALRADALPVYGYPRETAPFITELAGRSVVFDRAQSTSSWTSSAMASLFTSVYPNQHQVLTGLIWSRMSGSRPNRIPEDLVTLPEVMRSLGYRTFGIADNPNICQQMGFARGFDQFSSFSYLGAETVNRIALQWRDEIAVGSPYFFFLHYMDPHGPYHCRPPLCMGTASPSPRQAYDSEIAHVDAHIAELFRTFGWGDETLVILTADHGEEFLDHGGMGHPPTLYGELVKIPLLVHWPDRFTPSRVDALVSLVDLVPSLRELAGGGTSEQDRGESLVPLLRGEGGEPRTVFAMRFREWTEPNLVLKAVIDARWKYIVSTSGTQERFNLFDLEQDSKEHTDIVEAQPQVVEALGRRLDAFEAEAEVFPRAFADGSVLTPRRREELERLGYIE